MIRPSSLMPFIMFGISLVAIQGTIYSLQVASAAIVDVEIYSTIRTAESLSTIISLVLTFGLPSTLLVTVGRSGDSETIATLGVASISLVIVNAVLITLFCTAGMALGFGTTELERALLLALPLSILTALRLLFVAGSQAQQQFAPLCKVALWGCTASSVAFIVLSWLETPGVGSWITARILLEMTMIVGLRFTGFGRGLEFRTSISSLRLKAIRLLNQAAPVGGSLLLRSLLDHGPILLVAVLGANAIVAGEVGLILTVCTISLVPASIGQGVLVPQWAAAVSKERHTPSKRLSLVLVGGGLATGVIAWGLFVLLPFVVPWIEKLPLPVVLAATIAVIAKMISSMSGGFLLVIARFKSTLKINVVTTFFGVIALVSLVISEISLGTLSILTAVAVVEVIGAALYTITIFCSRNEPPADGGTQTS